MEYLTTLTLTNGHTVVGVVLHQLRHLFYLYRCNKLRAGDEADFHQLAQSWFEADTELPIVFFHPAFDDRFEYALAAHDARAISQITGPTYKLTDHFSPILRRYKLKSDGSLRVALGTRKWHAARKPRQRLELDPTTDRLIRQAVAAGQSTYTIAQQLNERQLPSLRNRLWCRRSIEHYLNREDLIAPSPRDNSKKPHKI